MSFYQERFDIKKYYTDNFFLAYSIPTIFTNEQPSQGFISGNESWIRLTVTDLSTVQSAINRDHPETTTEGLITFQVFTKPGLGTNPAYEIVDNLESVMCRKEIGDHIRTYSGNVTELGVQPNKGKWFQVNFAVRFRRYTRH